jgi:hypothetical protein
MSGWNSFRGLLFDRTLLDASKVVIQNSWKGVVRSEAKPDFRQVMEIIPSLMLQTWVSRLRESCGSCIKNKLLYKQTDAAPSLHECYLGHGKLQISDSMKKEVMTQLVANQHILGKHHMGLHHSVQE